MKKKNLRNRLSNEVNAGSMADIAFLLLIFFLVTTTISVDKGITVKLPPWNPDVQAPKISGDNLLSVLINSEDELLVEGELLNVLDLREKAIEFISNPSKRDDLPDNPKKAIISLKNDRGTSYEAYISVYNELTAAYNDLWDKEALRLVGKPYSNDLPIDIKRKIKSKIPFVLSEAEQSNFGEEL